MEKIQSAVLRHTDVLDALMKRFGTIPDALHEIVIRPTVSGYVVMFVASELDDRMDFLTSDTQKAYTADLEYRQLTEFVDYLYHGVPPADETVVRIHPYIDRQDYVIFAVTLAALERKDGWPKDWLPPRRFRQET